MAEPEEQAHSSTEPAELTLEKLVWDRWNVRHIASHDVTTTEVEEVCRGEFWVRASYYQRLILIGATKQNRIVAAILEPLEKGVYYPVTARPASRKERRLFSQWRERQEK